jgi:apolipoprotein D and lipocalin family protein
MLLIFSLYNGCSNTKPLDTVERIELSRYMGKWYEIASFPNRFQKGCRCTTAEYELSDEEYVSVVNTCRKDSVTGERSQAKGKAFVVEGSNNAKLKVQFFWPFRGDYYIIDIAPDYSYAVVGNPGRKYLWILNRTPFMEDSLYNSIVERAKGKGFDISKLLKTNQNCDHEVPGILKQ